MLMDSDLNGAVTDSIAKPLLMAMLVFVALYFLPTVVALLLRGSRRRDAILINIFLGWTVAGWVVALVLAFTGRAGTVSTSPGGPSGPGQYAQGYPQPRPQLSPDGRYYWNGSSWVPTQPVPTATF